MSTVTVVATVEPDNVPPRVRLDITDFGSPENFSVTVTRLDPDGRLVPVRTADGNPLTLTTSGITRVGVLYDPEPPYGEIVQYSTVEDPASSSGDVIVPATQVWLVHPGVPALSMPVSVAEIGALTRSVNRAVFRPMGRRTPIVVTDGARQSPEGVLELNTFTLVEAAAFEALTADASVLLLNVPPDFGWGLTTSYVSLGDLEEGRLVVYAGEPRRLHRLPFIVVDRPSGGTTAERTLTDLMDFPTLDSLMATYATFNDLLAGP